MSSPYAYFLIFTLVEVSQPPIQQQVFWRAWTLPPGKHMCLSFPETRYAAKFILTTRVWS
jgi:hypothetical protein